MYTCFACTPMQHSCLICIRSSQTTNQGAQLSLSSNHNPHSLYANHDNRLTACSCNGGSVSFMLSVAGAHLQALHYKTYGMHSRATNARISSSSRGRGELHHQAHNATRRARSHDLPNHAVHPRHRRHRARLPLTHLQAVAPASHSSESLL